MGFSKRFVTDAFGKNQTNIIRERLMDPNADLTDSEIRLGKGEQVKVSADIPSLISFIRKYLRFCQRKINIFHTKIFKVLSKKENQDEQVIL